MVMGPLTSPRRVTIAPGVLPGGTGPREIVAPERTWGGMLSMIHSTASPDRETLLYIRYVTVDTRVDA